MRLLLALSIVLASVDAANDLTVLLVGSRSKLTARRVTEHRARILTDCDKEEISCSVFDVLSAFSTEFALPQGMWTIVPAIRRLPRVADWTIVCEDTSEVDVANLKRFVEGRSAESPVFSGFGLQDRDATIIHHFGMGAPEGFLYPLLSAGFILSKDAAEKIRKLDDKERWSGFAIDANYEFSLLLHKHFNLHLEHNPDVFCVESGSEACLVRRFTPSPSRRSLKDTDIQVMIKTFEGHHRTRLPVLQDTWTRRLPRVEYCSDTEDLEIPTINMGVGNTDRGHCGKTWAIFRRFLEVSGTGAKWLLVADDDTLMSWKRLKDLLELYDSDSEDEIIIGERYGFGFGFDGESGYDYPTGGSGMIFSRSAVESLLKTCPSCAADSDPDDMTIGMCAASSGIPIVHEPRMHQARPQDYDARSLRHPISFHKFTDIDPREQFRIHLVNQKISNEKAEL